jgi:hypothetical protein
MLCHHRRSPQRVSTFVASGYQARQEERRDRNVLQVREDHEHPTNDAWRQRSKKFSPSRSQRKISTGTSLLRNKVVVVLPTMNWRMRE